MSVTANCPNCSWQHRVKDAARGKKGRCPECGHVFTIAGQSSTSTVQNGNTDSSSIRPRQIAKKLLDRAREKAEDHDVAGAYRAAERALQKLEDAGLVDTDLYDRADRLLAQQKRTQVAETAGDDVSTPLSDNAQHKASPLRLSHIIPFAAVMVGGCIIAGLLLLSGQEQSVRQSAKQMMVDAKKQVQQEKYEAARKTANRVVEKLDAAGFDDTTPYHHAEQLLTHLRADEVKYKGSWVSREEKKMRQKGLVKYKGEWVSREEKNKYESGYVKYNTRWVTPKEKSKLQQGLVQYEGKWVTPEEKRYREKGQVKFEGRWMSPRGKATIQCIRKVTEVQRRINHKLERMPLPQSMSRKKGLKRLTDICSEARDTLEETELQNVHPELASKVRTFQSGLATCVNMFEGLLQDIEDAEDDIFATRLAGSVLGGMAGGANSRSAGEAMLKGAVFGTRAGNKAAQAQTRKELAQFKRKWKPRLRAFYQHLSRLKSLNLDETISKLRKKYGMDE